MKTMRLLKTFYLSFIVMLFAACGTNSRDKNNEAEQRPAVKIAQGEFDERDRTWVMAEGGYVCVSEDRHLTIESGRHPGGGTAPDYWGKWTIVDDNGKKHELKFEYAPYVRDVHALSKYDGTTYYIVRCYARSSSVEAEEWLAGFKIVGDSIEEVSVVDGEAKIVNDPEGDFDIAGNIHDYGDFSIMYSIPDLFFATNGAGYDWIFEYDAETGELYVPIIRDYILLDHYMVWKFNGRRFKNIGEHPHKGLHESLGDYNRLLCYFMTKDHIVRVDSLDNETLRYASWRKPKTMADKPDLVLGGGKKRYRPVNEDGLQPCADYLFINHDYEYFVNYCETERAGDGTGRHNDYLLVKKGDRVIVKQRKEQL